MTNPVRWLFSTAKKSAFFFFIIGLGAGVMGTCISALIRMELVRPKDRKLYLFVLEELQRLDTPVFLIFYIFIPLCFISLLFLGYQLGSFVFQYYPSQLDRIIVENNKEAAKCGGYLVITKFQYGWLKGVTIEFSIKPQEGKKEDGMGPPTQN